jgi:Ribonuclease G/E
MATRVHVKQTVKTRRLKTGGDSGYHKCPSCNGTGRKKNVGRGAK